MKNIPTDPVPLLQDLIRCRSVTPAEGGALTYLEDLLSTNGFVCHRLIFRGLIWAALVWGARVFCEQE